MAKNLKLNVKNTQLAEALKKLKKPEGSSSKKEEKKTPSVSKAPAEKPVTPSLPAETKPTPPPQPLESPPKPKVEVPTPKPQPAAAPAPLKPEQPPKRFAPGFGPGGQRPPSAMRPSRPPYQRSSPPGGGHHRDFRSHPPRPGSFQRPDHQGGRPPFRPHGDRPGGSSFRPGGYRPPFNQGPRPPFNQGGRPPFSRLPLRPMPSLPKQGDPLPKTDKRTDDQNRRKTTAFKDFKDVKSLRKPEAFRDFDSRDKQGLRSEDDAIWRRRRRSSSHKGHLEVEEIIRPKSLKVRLPITIKDLASEMKVKASQLISTLFMKGVVLTLNDYLDDETTVQLLGHELDCEISIDTSEAERLQITDKTIRQEISEASEDALSLRPPVVTFMGHVDHGKTSLIDAIRKSNIAQGEAGAITQHIGAFQCHTPVGDITILDTPGHEAFSAMRSRGADVTDLVVLVIAGDEGMRAQTVEALEQARTSQVPIMVAINKSDKPNFDPENVYRQLSEQNLLPEAWGGQTITVNCSALTGQGVKELLEMLALQAEILELKANSSSRARGTVIESEMHKGLGAVATVLVQNGTLKIGDALVFDQCWGRVKTMHNEHGKEMVEAGPSSPAKITGLSGLPEAGSEFIVVENEREAREVSEGRAVERKHIALHHKKGGLENFLQRKAERQEKKILNLVLRADVQGSLEALKHSLEKIVSSKVELNIVSSEVGEISESDVQLASASKAVLIGFHTQIESRAEVLIKEMKVTVRLHDIIYHAVDDVKQLMLGLLDKIAQENDIGEVAVKAIFKSSHLGNIAGCQVADGLVRRNSHIRVIRNKEVIWKGPIASLKREKEDVKEVSKGQECGVVLQGFSDFKEGDLLQAFDITYLTQEL